MTALGIVACLLAATPTGEAAFGVAGVAASAGGGSGDSWSSWSAGGGTFATFYPSRPLVDDEAPLSLQAFQQRLTSVSVSGEASYGNSAVGERITSGGGSVSASGYLAGRLYLAAAFELGHVRIRSAVTSEDYTTVFPSGALGLRLDKAVLAVSWGYLATTPGQGRWRPRPDFGRVRLSLRAAFVPHGEVSLYFGSVEGGATAGLSGTVYPLRAFGIFASGGYLHGAPYVDTRTVVDHVWASLGLCLWVTPRTAVALSYDLSWTKPPLAVFPWISHGGTLSLAFRLPTSTRPPREEPKREPAEPRRPPRGEPPADSG